MIKSALHWIREKWIHIVIWFLFILYETVIVGLVFGAYGRPLTYAMHYFTIISYFYILAEAGLPWCLKTKRLAPLKIIVFFTLAISAYIYLNFLTDVLLIRFHYITHIKSVELNETFILKELYRCIYFTAFSTAYYFLITYIREKRKSTSLEELRLKNIIKEEQMARILSIAQNDYLKAQINPHFLFNTLDFVYHHVIKCSDVAAEVIISLSEMMRYAIASSDSKEYILLGDEILQIEKLIRIHQLRSSGQLNLKARFDKQAMQLRFLPLVLLTMVENIFKHGNSYDEIFPARVSVLCSHGILTIETLNRIGTQKNGSSGNNGLKNIITRLQFAFGDQVSFEHGPENNFNFYRVSINIPIAVLPDYGATSCLTVS